MGCIHPKKIRTDAESVSSSASPSRDHHLNENPVQKRIFDVEIHNKNLNGDSVSNQNGVGPSLRQGQLEITDVNLIYRTRGHNPIIWPLRFLRQYGKGQGQEKDIFSFECGRHCETGSGIFVFRCSEAEQLFAVLLDTIYKTSSQQQTLNHSSSQQSQSNTSRTIGPVTTATNNLCQSPQQPHPQMNYLASQHSENESLREYVNIPPSNNSTRNNVSTSSSNQFRPRSSLDQRSHRDFTLPSDRSPPGHEHFDGPTVSPRFSFDSSTLPNRRPSASNRVSQQSHSHQQTPLYVNSNSFDMAEKDNYPQRGNSSSFNDVSQSYTNVAFFNQQLDKNIPVSQSQKSFGCSPNYIQLDLAATSAVNGATTAHISPMNGAKSLSNLSRGASPQRITAGSNSGSSNSLHHNSPKRPFNFPSIISGPSQHKITLDTPVPLPPGLSYAKIDFERTAALSQLNHNRQQLAVNGNY